MKTTAQQRPRQPSGTIRPARRRKASVLPVIRPSKQRRKLAQAQTSSRGRVQRALTLHVQVQYQDGLTVSMQIGSAWLSLLISIVGAYWLPQIETLLKFIR